VKKKILIVCSFHRCLLLYSGIYIVTVMKANATHASVTTTNINGAGWGRVDAPYGALPDSEYDRIMSKSELGRTGCSPMDLPLVCHLLTVLPRPSDGSDVVRSHMIMLYRGK
jgi:hypothetical protein